MGPKRQIQAHREYTRFPGGPSVRNRPKKLEDNTHKNHASDQSSVTALGLQQAAVVPLKDQTDLFEYDILQDQRSLAGRLTRASDASPTKDRGGDVVEKAIHDGSGAYHSTGHVNADATVLDNDILVHPEPVPKLLDGGLAIDKRQIACRVLLVAKCSTPLTSVEDKIGKKAATPLLHVDPGMPAVGCLWHLKDNVLDGGRLRRWPVNAPGVVGNGCSIDDQVTDLAKENVGRLIGSTFTSPYVRLNDHFGAPSSNHVCGCLYGGHCSGIADQLSVVGLHYGRRHLVSPEISISRYSHGRRHCEETSQTQQGSKQGREWSLRRDIGHRIRSGHRR